MRRNHSLSLLSSLLALPALAACPDSSAEPDARIRFDAGPEVFDAALPDAALPDAAPLADFSSSVSLQELQIAGHPELGQGLSVGVSFSVDGAAAIFEEMPDSLFGCKVWEYGAGGAPVSLDEGTVTITSTGDTDPVIPPCVHTPAGYACLGASGAGGAISAGPMPGTFMFTDADAMFAADDVGRSLTLAGAAMPGNNSRFPILVLTSLTTVVIAGGTLALETLPDTATWVIVAATGPNPIGATLTDGFLENDDVFSIELASGGAGDWTSFTQANVTTGDSFVLSTEAATTIRDVPMDGSQFSIGCDPATCGSAIGSLLVITTTDAAIPPGAPDYFLPTPTAKQISIRCAKLGATTLIVPPSISAYLMSSGATRIQTTFLRSQLAQVTSSNHGMNIVVGHGWSGFSTP